MRGWKAQMTVIGTGGLPECKSAGNVMLPYSEFRISIRLPPTKNHKDAEHVLTRILTKDPPFNAKVIFIITLDYFIERCWCRWFQCT